MQIGSSAPIPNPAQTNGMQTQFPRTSGASEILIREAESIEQERQARSASTPPASLHSASRISGLGNLLDVMV